MDMGEVVTRTGSAYYGSPPALATTKLPPAGSNAASDRAAISRRATRAESRVPKAQDQGPAAVDVELGEQLVEVVLTSPR